MNRLISVVHVIFICFVFCFLKLVVFFAEKSWVKKGSGRLVIPSDPVDIVGAKGDEAMLNGLVDTVLSRDDCAVFTFVCSDKAPKWLSSSRHEFVEGVWRGPFYLAKLYSVIVNVRPMEAFLIGADIMDGHYSVVNSARMVLAAELISAFGIRTTITGYSFNDQCPLILRLVYKFFAKRASYNLRDRVSLGRFDKINVDGRLVADVAFLLKPTLKDDVSLAAIEWISIQKKSGRTVVGVNFHPMLFNGGFENVSYKELHCSILKLISFLVREAACSVLLVPHDDREFAGDIKSLRDVEAALDEDVKSCTYLINPPPCASDLKGIAAALDLVVTGRMHFCIASLGVGVPVVAFAYQSKFAGLYDHFLLPRRYILDPSNTDYEELKIAVTMALSEKDSLAASVSERLPFVKRLSLLNVGG